ncbi:MAG: competence protein, partial [Mycobacterium sp.]
MRLVPAALTGWIVTAVGITWPVGRVLALCCVALVVASAASVCCATWRIGASPRLRGIGAALMAIGVVGAGFGFAIALRAEAVDRHPITAAFGRAAAVTVTPTESAQSVGRGQVIFRATLQRLDA